MGVAEPASFDTVGETVRTNRYHSSSAPVTTSKTVITDAPKA